MVQLRVVHSMVQSKDSSQYGVRFVWWITRLFFVLTLFPRATFFLDAMTLPTKGAVMGGDGSEGLFPGDYVALMQDGDNHTTSTTTSAPAAGMTTFTFTAPAANTSSLTPEEDADTAITLTSFTAVV